MIRCVSCGEEYDDDEVIYTCEKCGSVLELVNEIDVSKVREELHFANVTNWVMSLA